MGDGAKLEDSNCALIGSDKDKQARKNSALTEEAWQNCGQEAGVKVWRVEKFKIKDWPKQDYGSFYRGDSYIVLSTKKVEDVTEQDIFFWLGSSTSIDEKGTAAYKTVELDAFFDDEATQHREVEGRESPEFKKLFKSLKYMEGGIETGFKHVPVEMYTPKLFRVQRDRYKHVSVNQVPMGAASLNKGDCFILDAGTKIYKYYGEDSNAFEKHSCGTAAENMENERDGQAKAFDFTDDEEGFWNILGGKAEVSAKEAVEESISEPVLYKISNESGSLETTEVARGDLKTSMLESDASFIVDGPYQLYVWVGKDADKAERLGAMNSAKTFLDKHDKDRSCVCFKEGKPIKSLGWQKIFGA